MHRSAITALVLLCAAAGIARADREAVALDYAAPEGCPDRAAVEAAVRERTPQVRFAAGAARTFAIAITERDGEYVGTLSVAATGDARELSAHRCDDLVVALALVTALAIDPSAGEVRAAAPPPPPPSPPRPPTPPWPIDGNGFAAVAFGITPDAMPVVGVAGRALPRPYLSLGVAAVIGYDRTELDMGAARFVWTIVRPAACWRPLAGRLDLGACGHVEAGLVRATGQNIVLGQSVTRSWFATGLHLEGRVALTSMVFMQLQVGASVPLQRDRYLFQPSMTIHETSPITAWVGAGVGVRFR